MTTSHKSASILAEIFSKKGLTHCVLSPGSRNAPLIIAFNRQPEITCLSISDERSAAFFALGMAQQLRRPVALICTSGTAALNFAPAIAEAYYQQIPLLIITADRPAEWINQHDGQAIIQHNIFSNYIRQSFSMPVEVHHSDEYWYCERIANEAIDKTTFPVMGPVHVNVPLREPLYDLIEHKNFIPKIIYNNTPDVYLNEEEQSVFNKKWISYNKKMIICGIMPPNQELNEILNKISQDPSVAILTETTSNLHGEHFFPCIDRMLDGFDNNFIPELLITIGGPLISRKIKTILRQNKASEHWHISSNDSHIDAFQSLTHNIHSNPYCFFKSIVKSSLIASSEYREIIKLIHQKTSIKHDEYLKTIPFSDLKAFEIIFKNIPSEIAIHLGNSTPIRYAQLFETKGNIEQYSNRGTSGIDGCSSTAVGAAFITQNPTLLITGDIGFVYDSNAFWNNYLSEKLRVIVINNGGGGIFRFIDGPDTVNELVPYIESPNKANIEFIAKAFGVEYCFADDEESLSNILPKFFTSSENPIILEIKTPRFENANILRNYFKYLKPTI